MMWVMGVWREGVTGEKGVRSSMEVVRRERTIGTGIGALGGGIAIASLGSTGSI